jgi:hypothetical protein
MITTYVLITLNQATYMHGRIMKTKPRFLSYTPDEVIL